MELDHQDCDAALPALMLEAPDGRRVTVAVRSTASTVGELADTIGLSRRSEVFVDGCHIERRRPLERTEIVQGSRLSETIACPSSRTAGRGAARTSWTGRRTTRSAPGSDPGAGRGASVEVVVEAGPAAGAVVRLGPGRHVLGRAANAAVRLDDELVELHHAVVDVDPGGRVTLTQIAGRVPCRALVAVASSPESVPIRAPTTLQSDSILTIGASRLRVRCGERCEPIRSAALTSRRDDPWRRTIHRTPRLIPRWDPSPIDLPVEATAQPSRSGGMLAAALTVFGGVLVAFVLRNPMFLIFSAMGFLVAVGTRVGGRIADRKKRKHDAGAARRAQERFAEQVAAQRAERVVFHRTIAPTIETTLAAAASLADVVWSRRTPHDDVFSVAIGWGTESWTVRVGPGSLTPETDAVIRRAQRLEGQPVLADLGRGRSLAIAGANAIAVARSLVMQLATWTGPADWRLLVVAEDVDEWEWCAWLPHTRVGGRSDIDPTVVDAHDGVGLSDALRRLDDGDERHVIVVTDRADLLSTRTGPLRRYLGSAGSVAVLAVVGDGAAVPAMCSSLLHVGSLGQARWCAETSVATTSASLHATGISQTVAAAAARRLAQLHDPEDPLEAAGSIPAAMSLSSLMSRCGVGAVDDAIAIAAGWRSLRPADAAAGAPRDGRLRAAIGVTADGVVEIDLVRDGPHALIAGTTGSGKSELLRTLVVSMAARCSPDEVTFVLIDYKGGSTFDACADLPHTVGVVTDLDDRLAERALSSLDAEIRRRERLLRAAAADDLDAYRHMGSGPLPRLVVVIDEFAAMAADLPGFLAALVGVAQRGRSLGIHLVLATQRPAGVVSEEIRTNTNLRIALRLQDRSDAHDIVGDAEPTTFARGTPGRAMMRLGPGETLVFQAANSSVRHRPNAAAALHVLVSSATTATPSSPHDDAGPEATASSMPEATELVVLTRSIRSAASLCEIEPPFRPWLEPLSASLGPDDVASQDGAGGEPDVCGLVDDPAGQRRLPLRWQRKSGNLALVGSFGSGTSTAMRSAVIAAGMAPDVYVLDCRGDGRLEELMSLSNCGAVVGLHDAERRGRLLGMLDTEIRARQASQMTISERRPLVFAIDGLAALNAALSGPAEMGEQARLATILADGLAARIHTIATFERPTAVPASMLAAFGQRWLFHLDDPLDASGLGVKAGMTPPAVPGRIVVAGTGLEAQVAVLTVPDRADAPDHDPHQAGGPPKRDVADRSNAPAIGTLAEVIESSQLPKSAARDGATSLVLGIDFATLVATALDVPDGEHAIILGPARSGRSTALIRAISAWRSAHPDGEVVVRCPRRHSPVLGWITSMMPDATVAGDDVALAAAIEDVPDELGQQYRLIAIDDAERVDDPSGDLLALVSARHAHVMVVAAGRPDALRSMYGHWTAVVRRSRLGLVMTAGSENDGELLGETLPRRPPVGARPGLAWLCDTNGRRLVQVASDSAAQAASADRRLSASRHDTRLPVRRIERE